jgi:hypothetical protein
MLRGIKTIVLSVLVSGGIGAVFGVLVGALIGDRPFGGIASGLSSGDLLEALTDPSLIATALLAFLGANFGLALAYGFLPESEADLAEAQPEAG